MAEKSNAPLQIRTQEEVSSKFKAIAEDLGVPQGTALDLMIQAYETSALKTVLPDRTKEIEEFEGLSKKILEFYKSSLLLNKTAEDRIREEFSSLLDKRNKQIEKFQTGLAESNEKKESIASEVKDLRKTIAELSESNRSLKSEIATKNDLIKNYKEKTDDLSGIISEYKDHEKEYQELKALLQQKETENADLKRSLSEKDMDTKRELAELKEHYQDQIYSIREEYNKRLLDQLDIFKGKQ
jgi:chromosome segregation ATPase